MMMKTMKQFLDNIPNTSRDEKVVALEPDTTVPPRVLSSLYTQIKVHMRSVTDLTARVLELERRTQEFLEQQQQEIARAKAAVRDEIARMEEAQTRWVMITRDLGIDIQDEAPASAQQGENGT